MRKISLFLVMSCLLATGVFLSCNKDEDDKGGDKDVVKLLEKTDARWSDYDYIQFVYDDKNRMKEMLLYNYGELWDKITLIYVGDDLTKIETEEGHWYGEDEDEF